MTRRLALVSLCAVMLAAPRAHADSAHEAEATALFNEGARLAHAKDYEHARIKFEAAVNLVDSPNTWWNLAFTEYKSGHYVAALRHARKYLRSGDDNAKHVETYNHELLPGCASHVGQLTIDTAPDALVRIDGDDEIGRAPFADPVAVTPGKHHLEARRPQGTISADVEVAAGATAAVSLAFVTPSVAPVVDPKLEHFDSPAAPQQPPPETSRGEAPPSRANPLHVVLPISLVVAGAVFIGVGAGFASESNSAANDAQSVRNGMSANACINGSAPGCSQFFGDVHSQNVDKTISIVLYSAGAASFVGAALAWFLVPKEIGSGTTVVGSPLVGPGLLGARLVTSF